MKTRNIIISRISIIFSAAESNKSFWSRLETKFVTETSSFIRRFNCRNWITVKEKQLKKLSWKIWNLNGVKFMWEIVFRKLVKRYDNENEQETKWVGGQREKKELGAIVVKHAVKSSLGEIMFQDFTDVNMKESESRLLIHVKHSCGFAECVFNQVYDTRIASKC